MTIIPPRVLPVLDLRAGIPVHAVGGDRARYQPLRSVLLPGRPGDAIGLARACRDHLGATELYLADLDAINATAPPNLEILQEITNSGLTLWLDAGVRVAADVTPLIEAGMGVVVLGLETLRGPGEIPEILQRHDPSRFALSLDLRDGRPLVPTTRTWGTEDPAQLAERGLAFGLRRMIVLDLARVGGGQGVGTLPLLTAIRSRHPTLDLLAGGGVAGRDDLRTLAAAGASGVLVGSALHDGRLGREDLADPSSSPGWMS